MKKRCPFCHTEIDIPEKIGEEGYCRCGAYGQISLLSGAHSFLEKAKKALGIDVTKTGRFMEVVDGGIVFEEKGEAVIIQWAKKPQISL
jgi:hypothetical protein